MCNIVKFRSDEYILQYALFALRAMPAKRVEYRTYSGVQPPSFLRPGRENRSPLQTEPSKKEKKITRIAGLSEHQIM